MELADAGRYLNALAYGLTSAVAGFWLRRRLASRVPMGAARAGLMVFPALSEYASLMTEPLLVLLTLLALVPMSAWATRRGENARGLLWGPPHAPDWLRLRGRPSDSDGLPGVSGAAGRAVETQIPTLAVRAMSRPPDGASWLLVGAVLLGGAGYGWFYLRSRRACVSASLPRRTRCSSWRWPRVGFSDAY